MKNFTRLDKSFIISEENPQSAVLTVECEDKDNRIARWQFKWKNTEEYNKWTRQIKHAIRPVWEDPLASKICKECARPFTVTRRQHHCRRCGKAVCARHSENRAKIPDMGYYTAVRVCDFCFARMDSEGQRHSLNPRVFNSPRSSNVKPEIYLKKSF